MDSLSAFAMGEANQGNPLMVFDWRRAAELIAKNPGCDADAGLAGDWEYTGGAIWRDGKPVPEDDTYAYLASTWATPELSIDGDTIDCWIWQSDSPGWNADDKSSGWNPGTYWPQEALDIIAVADL